MAKWLLLLGGLIVWAAHFFLLYIIASIFPGQGLVRVLTLIAALPALAGNAAILWAVGLRRRQSSDDFDIWILNIAALGAVLSLVAVIWQTLPAVIA